MWLSIYGPKRVILRIPPGEKPMTSPQDSITRLARDMTAIICALHEAPNEAWSVSRLSQLACGGRLYATRDALRSLLARHWVVVYEPTLAERKLGTRAKALYRLDRDIPPLLIWGGQYVAYQACMLYLTGEDVSA
jgi:hypothetical protein